MQPYSNAQPLQRLSAEAIASRLPVSQLPTLGLTREAERQVVRAYPHALNEHGYTQLFQALRSARERGIKMDPLFIKGLAGDAVNDYCRGSEGQLLTPLSLAIEANDLELASALLKRGACPNQPTGTPGNSKTLRYTPLQYACKLGKAQMCELLYQHGAKINMHGPGGTKISDLLASSEIFSWAERHGAYIPGPDYGAGHPPVHRELELNEERFLQDQQMTSSPGPTAILSPQYWTLEEWRDPPLPLFRRPVTSEELQQAFGTYNPSAAMWRP